jgi:uncharacterized protein with von Willebrand factor type A (vWA) domain
MKKITKRIQKESRKIRGGDFSDWYEGLSPIEKVVYGQTLRIKNILFPL